MKNKILEIIDEVRGKFDKKASFFALVYWLFINVLVTNDLFGEGISIKRKVFFRLMQLLFLLIIFNLVKIVLELADRKKIYRRMLKISVLYFLVLSVVLVIVWPGLYNWDDIWVLEDASHLLLNPWQHFLTSLVHIVSILCIPIASGVLIFQNIIISLIVGYVATFAPASLIGKKKRTVATAAIMIVMLFSPIVFYSLTGYRIAIYQFLEIFIITFLARRLKTRTGISFWGGFVFVVASILLCSWRSEGLIYLVFLPIVLFALYGNIIGRKKIILCLAIITASSLSISWINGRLNNEKGYPPNYYQMGAGILPASGIIDGALENGDNEVIGKFSRVIDIECVEKIGIIPDGIFWKCIKPDYGLEDYELYKKSIIQYAPKYYKNILSLYRDMFCDLVIGAKCGESMDGNKSTQAYKWAIASHQAGDSFFRKAVSLPLNSPISDKVRNGAIRLLYGVDEEGNKSLWFYSFNTLAPMLLALIVTAFVFLFKNKKIMAIIVAIIMIKTLLVFVTSMTPFLMYYMPTYVSIFVLLILSLNMKRKTTKS